MAMNEALNLDNIRSALIRLEESIIFSLIERAQFGKNLIIYRNNGIQIPDWNGSFMLYLLHKTEVIHAGVRRYTAPDEHPFTTGLPEPVLDPMAYNWPIKKTAININPEILDIYIKAIIPEICENDDDGNYGSSVVNDIIVLQNLSKRIHYGKFVAESKFLQDEISYKNLILKKDNAGIMELLTDQKVEDDLLERVEVKASAYGQDPKSPNPVYKIKPQVIRKFYQDFIIPLTKKVEVMYLLERLN
jgi:chorismate mutase